MSDNPTSCDRCSNSFEKYEPALKLDGKTLCRNCHDKLKPVCPSCNKPMKAMPEYKSPCRLCGQILHIKRKQIIYKTLLLTQDHVDFCDKVDRAIATLKPFGITQWHYVNVAEEFEADTGRKPTDYDLRWKLFYTASKMTNNANKLASLFYEEARFVYQNNRDPYFILRKAQLNTLTHLQKVGVTKVKISGPTDECSICRHHCQNEISIDDALKQLQAPFRECPLQPDTIQIDINGEPVDSPKPNSHPFCESHFVPVDAPVSADATSGDDDDESVFDDVGDTQSLAVVKPSEDAWEIVDDEFVDELEEDPEVIAKATMTKRNGNGKMMYLVDDWWLDATGVPVPTLFISNGSKRGVWILDEEKTEKSGNPKYVKIPKERIQKIIAEVMENNRDLAERRRKDKGAIQELWQAVEGALMLGTIDI